MNKCAVCGTEFEPKNVFHKFCSKECKLHLMYGYLCNCNRRDDLPERKCHRCGKPFVPTSERMSYCSVECFVEGRKRASESRRPIKRIPDKSPRQAMMERLAARDREFAAWNPNAGPRKTYWKSTHSEDISSNMRRFY